MFTSPRRACAVALSMTLSAVACLGVSSAQALTTVKIGISSKPVVASWGVSYAFLHQGGALTFVGSIRPARAGKMTLQYSDDGAKWISLVGGTVDSAGNTSVVIRPNQTRSYRWLYYGDSGAGAAASAGIRPVIYPSYRSYRNCAELNKYYTHGVGRPNAADSTSSTPVRNFLPSINQYALNDGGVGQADLDRDNDGIACEKR